MKALILLIPIAIIVLISGCTQATTQQSLGDEFERIVSAKYFEIATMRCVDGTRAMAMVRNAGKSGITVTGDGKDLTILDSNGDAPSSVSWTKIDGSPLGDTIEAGNYAQVTIDCTTIGNPVTCSYDFILADKSPIKVNVICSGE